MIGIEGKIAIAEEPSNLFEGEIATLTELVDLSSFEIDEDLSFERPVGVSEFQGSSDALSGNENRSGSISFPLLNSNGVDKLLKFTLGNSNSYQGDLHFNELIGTGNGINQNFSSGISPIVADSFFVHVDETLQPFEDVILLDRARPRKNLSLQLGQYPISSKLKIKIDADGSNINNKPVVIEGLDIDGDPITETLYDSILLGNSQTRETVNVYSEINKEGIFALGIDPNHDNSSRISVIKPSSYSITLSTGEIHFFNPPADGAKIYITAVESVGSKYVHVLNPKRELPTFSIATDEILKSYQYSKSVMDRLNITIDPEDYVNCSADFISCLKNEITFPTLSSNPDARTFNISSANLYINSQLNTNVEKLELEISNNIDYINPINSTPEIQRGALDISVKFEENYDTTDFIDLYENKEVVSLIIDLENKLGDKIIIFIPSMYIEKITKPLEGTDFVDVSSECFALKSKTDSDKIRIFVVNDNENI